MKDSIKRIAALSRLSAVFQMKNIVIAAAGTYGTLTVITIVAALGGTGQDIHAPFFGLLLFVGGYITTSLAFIELHVDRRSEWYILLPASAAEKVAERVLTTSVGYVLALVVTYSLFSIVSSGITTVLLGRSFGVYLPVDRPALQMIRKYLLSHAVILFGAVYFRRKNLLKTAAAITAIGLALGFFTAGVAWVFFGSASSFPHGPMSAAIIDSDLVTHAILRITRWTPLIRRFAEVAFYLLTPAFWVMTWIRLRETEVTHGI